MAASVPEETRRTISIEGTARAIELGHLDLGGGGRAVARAARGRLARAPPPPRAPRGPRMSGPHEPRKSRYERPSTSSMRAPEARATKNGSFRPRRETRAPGYSRRRESAAGRTAKSDSDRVMAPFPSRAALGTVNSMGRKSRAAGSQAKAPAVGGSARQHRDHDVHRVRIRGLAVRRARCARRSRRSMPRRRCGSGRWSPPSTLRFDAGRC